MRNNVLAILHDADVIVDTTRKGRRDTLWLRNQSTRTSCAHSQILRKSWATIRATLIALPQAVEFEHGVSGKLGQQRKNLSWNTFKVLRVLAGLRENGDPPKKQNKSKYCLELARFRTSLFMRGEKCCHTSPPLSQRATGALSRETCGVS